MTAPTPRAGGSTAERAFRARARPVVVYVALWIPVIVIYAAALLTQSAGAIGTLGALRSAAQTLLPPIVTGVALWWLSGRLPWRDGRAGLFVLVHATLMLAFGALWTAWIWMLIVGSGSPGAVNKMAQFILPWQAITALVLYALMTAVAYAIRSVLGARDLRLAVERSERLRAQAELAALRAHINPHFLFNTLHSVTQMLRGDPARAESSLERLSDLFRHVLRLDRQRVELVTLEDEWQFTSSYLWLEQLRMGDRLRVDAQLDDDALACAVPPFTLQPLVENAVRHGLAPKREGGTVRIRATERDGRLLIVVSDDGMGAAAAAAADGAGLGVRAVRQRLEARHGAAASAGARTLDAGGYEARLELPAEPLPADAGVGALV